VGGNMKKDIPEFDNLDEMHDVYEVALKREMEEFVEEESKQLSRQRLEQLKEQRTKENLVGEAIDLIPFAWRNPVQLLRKKPNKALKNMFELEKTEK